MSIRTTAWGALIEVCGMSKTDAIVAKRAATRLLELDPLNDERCEEGTGL